MDWMFLSHQNSDVEIMTTSVAVLEDGASKEVVGLHEVMLEP